MFAGPVARPAAVPIHKPSVLRAFKREPELCLKMCTMSKALLIENSLARISVVSSAYCDTLLCLHLEPGI